MRGGSLDAFTGRDYTSYQAHVLDADLPLAVEILTDLVRRPLLRESDLEPERNVILEEINGVEDTPDDLVFELHAADALARPSLRLLHPRHARTRWPRSRPTTSAACTRPATTAATAWSRPRATWTTTSCSTVLEREGWFEGAAPEPPRAAGRRRRRPCAAPTRREERDTAQTHIVFGTDTFPLRDPRRFALAILTNVFGGGMSSRLFQRVREELGLAYAVFAYKHFYQSAGQLGVYVGTQPATRRRRRSRPSARSTTGSRARACRPDELADGKQQLKGQVMLSLESPMAPDGPAGRLQLCTTTGTARSTRCWRRSTR